MMTPLFLLNISYSGMTRPRPTEMTMSTTNYALRKLPKHYRIIPRPSSYVPITNTDNSRQRKRCLYESKIYPGLMIPCPTSRYRMPPYRQNHQENDDVYDQVDDENPVENEEIEDKGDYPEDHNNRENQNQDEYEEENPLPLNADEQFEQLVTRVRCKGKKCTQNNNHKYKDEENESQENEYESENENENEKENVNEEEEESQEESPDSKEEEQKPLPKPKPKPKPIPKPKGVNPNLHHPLAVIHNYQPANFTKIKNKNKNGEADVDKNKDNSEEEDDDEDNSQESLLEDLEEYNEGDDLQDDEYYYDDEEEYDQTPKKPKIPQKLINIDDMKFKGEGDEPSESISKNTVLKNVSKTNDLHKPHNLESTQIPYRPKPYDSAAEAYTRVKDKNKPQDQQVMQMAIHETTVALNLIEKQNNKYKLPTKTDTTTVSAKYKPRPTIRPNILKRPQQISVPSYVVEQTVQPMTTAKTTTSTSNHNGTQYDPAFYSIYDDDSEIYKDVDYGQFTLSSVNNNNNRLKPQHQPQHQSQPQLQLQSQPQQDTFRVPAPLQQPTQRYQANTFVPEYNLKITEEEAQREQQTKATYRSTVVGVSPFVPDRSKIKFPVQTSTPSRFTFPISTSIPSTLPSTTLSTIISYQSTPSLFLRPPSPQGNYFWTTMSTTQKSKPTPPDFRIIVDPYNTTQYDVTTHRGTVKTTPFKVRTTQAPSTTSTTPSTTTTTSTTTTRSVDFDQEYDVVVEDEGTGYIDDNSVEKTSTTSSTTIAPLRSSELKNTNDYSRVKSGPSIQPVTVPAPTSKTVTECRECNEKPSRGRVRGGATYTTASSNDIDRGTPAVGRTRPTLKPSTSIVSKASEFVDVYKYAPSRPDPIYPTPQPDKTAAKCRKDVCQLPDCSCGGKEIPGDLAPEETPQIVLLTFDDSVNDLNKGLYTDLFEKGRVNPNGCPISATFYVSHEWTDYSQVQNLYASGHEIASHSVSHSFGEQFSQKKWTKEIVGQREILSAYGGVRQEDIRGMRAPFLAVGGNKMFKMLYDSNFTYDSSMPIYENKPPSWPYTLDYKLFHDCMIPPCPTRSYPGVWEVPMVMWQDLNGGRCSMGDACSNPSDADGVQKMLMKNFDRHFTSNRAPFGLFYHAAWFTQPHHKEGFIKFLDNIVSMPEVWIVTNWQAIQWVRDPTSISRLQSFTPFHCDLSERPKKCNNPKVCNLWHKSGVRYMRTCQPCPDIYPWTGKSGIRSSRIDDGSE